MAAPPVAPPSGAPLPGSGLTPGQGTPAAVSSDPKAVSGGFGCQVGGGAAPAALALPLVLLGLLAVRRRRR